MPHLSAVRQETELLLAVSQGDERAFTTLYNHYHKRLGIHIFRITKSPELAEEVVHDVFLKIWLNRETLVNVENFPVYLYVISKNAALNCLKRVAREKAVTTELEPALEQISLPDTREDDYRYILIDEAIDRLPHQQRQAYLLARHERLSYQEVATRMNLSKETIKKYLQLATESISAYINKRLTISILLIIQKFI